MNDLTRFIEPAFAEALGWSLLHTLWQGAAIALMLALLLLLSRNRPPQFRYLLSIGAMFSLLLSAIATFFWLYEPGSALPLAAGSSTAASVITPEVALPAPASDHPAVFSPYFQPHLPLIAVGWLLGVLLLGLRLLGEFAYLHHLRHYRCAEAGTLWMERLGKLVRQIGLNKQVRLKETARIHSPMVSGVLKPVILLPIGMLNSLSVAEVEQILLHELAHVRRQDYLVNLLVAVVETLFFFHPFVWWMGSRIRTEREHACDDLAIEVSGNAATYVTALAQAESWRMEGRRLSMAFAGGTVLQRVQRILGQDSGGSFISGKAAGAILVAGCAGLLFTLSTPTHAEQVRPFEPEALNEVFEEMPSPVKQAQTKLEPKAEPKPEPQSIREAAPKPGVKVECDTVPPEAEMEEAIEQEMKEMERALRAQERALEGQIIESERAIRAKLLEEERALAKMESKQMAARLEMERAMQEIQSQERQLELQELELEQQELELERQEEELEQLEEEGQDEAYLNKMRALQQQEMQLLEASRQVENQAFEIKEKARQLEMLSVQQEQALESQQNALEREMHQMERQLEQQIMELEQQRDMLEAETKARKKALKRRKKEMKQRSQGKAE